QWNTLIILSVLSVAVLAILGFYDDYTKIIKANGGGTTPRGKLMVQFALATFIGIFLCWFPATSKLFLEVTVLFYKHPVLTGMSVIGLAVAVLTIVGSSNAVNLTDGLDGLAIGCTVIVSFVFLIMTFAAGNADMARYLIIPYVRDASELTV